MKYLILILLCAMLGGCAAYKPNAPILQADKLSDTTIFQNASEKHEFYSARGAKAKILGTSGAIGLAGLATAGAAASQAGASPGTMAMIISTGNFIGQFLGIVEPADRAAAYDAGKADIEDAQGDYMGCLTLDGPATLPLNLTPCGAGLSKKMAAISRVVDAMINRTRYTKADLEIIEKRILDLIPKKEIVNVQPKIIAPVPQPTGGAVTPNQ